MCLEGWVVLVLEEDTPQLIENSSLYVDSHQVTKSHLKKIYEYLLR